MLVLMENENNDNELSRLREIKAARLRLGLDKPEAKKGEMKVTVYSTPTCPYCVMAKQYLSAKGVKYTDVDVSRDAAAAMKLVKETGQSGVPQISINGEWIVGFDRQAIDRALSQ